MDIQPLVSVILSTYNRPQELANMLRSLARQTYANFEVLVVNIGGTDVEDVIRGTDIGHPVSFFRLPENTTISIARNTAVRAATGEFFAYLDDNDLYYPQHLERLALFLRDNPEYGAAYTDAHQGRIIVQANGLTTMSKEEIPARDFNRHQLLVSNYIPAPCMMHRRACLEQTGFFDENLTSLADWDLWIRIALRYPIRRIPIITALFTSKGVGTFSQKNLDIDAINNLLIIYRKHEISIHESTILAEIRMQYILGLYRDLAEQHEHNGKNEEAERLWQRIVGLSGRPEDLLCLGLLRKKMGKETQARLTLNLANELRSPRTANGD